MVDGIPSNLAGAVDLSSLKAQHDRAAQAEARGEDPEQAGAVSSLSVAVTDQDFQSIAQLSAEVPVILVFGAESDEASSTVTALLETLVTEHRGALVLGRIDGDRSPQLAGAFGVSAVPTVAALIGGRPAPLFSGAVDEQEVRSVLDQVLQFAASQGITGKVPVADAEQPEQAEKPVPPLHQAAYDAIDRADYQAAIAAFEQAIAENPRDGDAVAGLAQVRLLHRLDGVSADQVRSAAAGAPNDVAAQLLAADLDVSGGHIDDAFSRVLDVIARTSGDERTDARLHLLDLFEIVGTDDARVGAARAKLMTLLY